MILTQRMVILAILANILCGLSITIYNHPNEFSVNNLVEQNLDTVVAEQASDNSAWGSVKAWAAKQFETTPLDAIRYGGSFFSILVQSANPLSIKPSMFDDTIGQIIAYLLMFVRSTISILMGVEIYSYIKNKKAT